MRNAQSTAVFGQIHTLYSVGAMAGLGDGQLVERFIARQGEGAELAFAALVERHGPMVFRVCRRFLNDPHDAQDAFQATFLVLVRKAGSLSDRGSVGNWLYGVAARIARDARSTRERRTRHEQRFAEQRAKTSAVTDASDFEFERAVHFELERLPERYRAPIVLCCLEGLSHEEAAARLERPVGTIRSRLARGREQLRGRLARHGYVPTGVAFAAALATEASASVPAALFERTVCAAAHVAITKSLSAEVVSAGVASLIRSLERSAFMLKAKYAVALATAIGVSATAVVRGYQDAPAEQAKSTNEYQGRPNRLQAKTKAGSRVAAAEEHLQQTKEQVDAAVTDLRAEVEELRDRLRQAEAVLQRMEALKAALEGKQGAGAAYGQAWAGQQLLGGGRFEQGTNQPLFGKSARQPVGQMGVGFGKGGGGGGDFGKPGRDPNTLDRGQGGTGFGGGRGAGGYGHGALNDPFQPGQEKPGAGQKQGRSDGFPKTADYSQQKPEAPKPAAQPKGYTESDTSNAADRRRAIQEQIERLQRERDKLDSELGEQPKTKAP
jgi:RNA polymerase sigma factor (sigma-70 family)